MNRRDALLWSGILMPPAIWFLAQLANFAVAPLACSDDGKPAMYAISIAAIVLTGTIAAMAAMGWRRLRTDPGPDAGGGTAGRVRGMALAALAMSTGFLLVEIAISLPNFLLAGCE